MPLRKRLKTSNPSEVGAETDNNNSNNSSSSNNDNNNNATMKKTKRQRLADFFKSRKQKKAQARDAHPAPITVAVLNISAPTRPSRDSKIAESRLRTSTSSDHAPLPTPPPEGSHLADSGQGQEPEQEQEPEPEPEPESEPEHPEPARSDYLSEDHIRTLFSGAPHFFVHKTPKRSIPRATYPWDHELAIKDVSDSVQFAEPAFSAATLHRHLPTLQKASDQDTPHHGYNVDVVEIPNLLSAQGIEPGTIGFAHFLELPQSDHLVTDLQQSQTSNDYLEAMRNKQLMQQNPERLGIRNVDMAMVHDRLVELGDLVEAFHDSPERMTILNNQPPGDLYANLFGKFLTPPGYDSTVDDPTGIKVQIDTLLKILRLRGVWFDFSLVEWRIRLGQILWSDSDPETDLDLQPLWTDRDLLLLQITLSCELLLRLDAITSMDVDDVKVQMHVTPQDVQGFMNLKTRKTDWDLVLARRFLENILVVNEINVAPSVPEAKPRGLLSLLSPTAPKDHVTSGIIFLPQHQARQLAGLLHFAQTVQWPAIDLIVAELAKKMCAPEAASVADQTTTPAGRVLDPSTPASVSVYGTPLATPRSNIMLDSYFGNMQRPTPSRSDSRSLQMTLTTTLLANVDGRDQAINVGGWLSRSYLTGLILPGEAMSHFLMSTLLENDKLAIAALGDSANLYGGFVYAERTWWSKASIVARVLACIEGASECMGWITFARLPADPTEGWYAVKTSQLRPEQPSRLTAEEDLVIRNSAVIPGLNESVVKAEHLTLPRDAPTPPVPAVEFVSWNLTPVSLASLENDTASTPTAEAESYTASVTFSALGRNPFAFSLAHDVHFVTSYPCTPPAASPLPTAPRLLKRNHPPPSPSRTSSKRSFHSSRTASNRSSQLIRRNSHGFEPLLSHPPDSPSIAPTRMYFPVPGDGDLLGPPRQEPLNAHPLHVSHRYRVVPASEVLEKGFVAPMSPRGYSSPIPTPQDETEGRLDSAGSRNQGEEDGEVLVLDARASRDLEIFARAWCAESGFHAVVGRVGRTCLACCVREAKGLGIRVVIRV